MKICLSLDLYRRLLRCSRRVVVLSFCQFVPRGMPIASYNAHRKGPWVPVWHRRVSSAILYGGCYLHLLIDRFMSVNIERRETVNVRGEL